MDTAYEEAYKVALRVLNEIMLDELASAEDKVYAAEVIIENRQKQKENNVENTNTVA